MRPQSYKIGYFIPEFPAQTHIFFWREILALKKLGVAVELISTMRPPDKLVSHDWAETAMSKTSYLFPLTFNGLKTICYILLYSGPKKWFQFLKAIFNTEGILGGRIFRIIGLAFMGIQLAGIALKKDFQHVHVHSCADSAIIALFAGKISNLSYSITLHGPLPYYGDNQKNKWRNAAFGITVTDALMHEVKEDLRGFLPPVLKKAPMGVDIEILKRMKPYVPWTGDGVCRVFSCARLNDGKRHNDIIDAVYKINHDGFPTVLRIAGEDDSADGRTRKNLEALIHSHALEDKVFLLGAVSEEVVRRELEEAHFFVLASDYEAIGVATMEAMAMGVPVIVTDVGGVSELVRNTIDGIMFEPKQTSQLVSAMKTAFSSPDLAVRLSISGRERVAELFHSGVSAQAIYECLRDQSV